MISAIFLKKIGVGFNADVPVPIMAKYANTAESLGIDSFWIHEHSFGRDAISYLSAEAQSTIKIKLGVACMSAYTRHPVVLAMSMLSLQEASQGRVVFGLGTGFPMRLDAMGIAHSKPIAALKETMEICRSIWGGSSTNLDGRIYSMKDVKSIAGKLETPIPIYIAGWKKQMLLLAGALADGYIAKGGESPQSLSRIVSGIRTGAEKNGRKLSDLEICAYLLTVVAETKEKAHEVARNDPFVSYMLSVQDDYLYEETGISPELKKPIAQNYFKGQIQEASRHVNDEMLEAFTLCGTIDQIGDRIQDYLRAGLNLPILQPISVKQQDVSSLLNGASTLISAKIDKPIPPW